MYPGSSIPDFDRIRRRPNRNDRRLLVRLSFTDMLQSITSDKDQQPCTTYSPSTSTKEEQQAAFAYLDSSKFELQQQHTL